MLSGLLEKHTCAECKYCCVFDKEDFWETPCLLPDTAKAILNVEPNTILNQVDGVYLFDRANVTNELYSCPALSNTGCTLDSSLKPFECSIWPFRVMLYNNDLVLAISTDCEGLKNVSNKVIDDFANTHIRSIAFEYAKRYPQSVKIYHNNYRIISQPKDNTTLER